MKLYLDNNATTPLLPEVKSAIMEYLEVFGNPSSMHQEGRRAHKAYDKARKSIASFLKGDEKDFIFVASGSEANNTILKQVLFKKYDFIPHVVISEIEHPAILETAKFLETQGVEVTYLKVNSLGLISLEDFQNALKKETVLVSIMWANNEVGVVQPIEAIGEICMAKNIWFHVDAVQAVGKIPLNLEKTPVHSLALSGHKIHAPKGIGALYVKNLKAQKKTWIPLIHGGHQEGGFRAGTENMLGIVALGAACEALAPRMEKDVIYLQHLRDSFEEKMIQKIPHIQINGQGAPRLPGTSNITFRFVEGESILLRLDMAGVCVSTGSACATGSLDPSHVLMALTKNPELAHGSVRFSFDVHHTLQDVEELVSVLEKQIHVLRMMSPLNHA